MSHTFRFDDPFYPLPSAAMDADPVAAMRELFYRVARLEQSLQEQRVHYESDLADALLTHIALVDDLARAVERIGVPTNAQHAVIARNVAALGQKVMAVLRHHQVTAIETLGKRLDVTHSDVIGEEERPDLPEGTVVREEQVGYLWRYGVLRRARVVVSVRPGRERGDSAS